jgi:hypothetical protein
VTKEENLELSYYFRASSCGQREKLGHADSLGQVVVAKEKNQ